MLDRRAIWMLHCRGRGRWLTGVALLAGCIGGQSGTDVYDGPPSEIAMTADCACGMADRAVVVRGRLLRADACEVSVLVTDILAGAGHAQVLPGETVVGRPFQCGERAVRAGDEVAAVFAPGALDLITVYPWSDPLDVSDPFVQAEPLAASELLVLADRKACRERVYGERWLGPELTSEEQGLPGDDAPLTLSGAAAASAGLPAGAVAEPGGDADGVSGLSNDCPGTQLDMHPVPELEPGPGPAATTGPAP